MAKPKNRTYVGWSDRKDAKYYRVIYTYKTPNNFTLEKDFRIKSKDEKNAISQAKKSFKLYNDDFVSEKDKYKDFKVKEVFETDNYFKRKN